MKCGGYAYFVKSPRILEDLLKPHPVEMERQFKVVKTIRLSKIDYENFITDMIADRQFIEENAKLCSKGTVWNCIFVQQRGREDGVLVLPTDQSYVGWAAYLPRGH